MNLPAAKANRPLDVEFVEMTEDQCRIADLERQCRLYELACSEQYEEFLRLEAIAIGLATRLAVYEPDALLEIAK